MKGDEVIQCLKLNLQFSYTMSNIQSKITKYGEKTKNKTNEAIRKNVLHSPYFGEQAYSLNGYHE